MSDVKERWAEFLNPNTVRTKLVTMGLFMIAHDMLINSIKRSPRELFNRDDYRREVLALDPKGKDDVLRSSLACLQRFGIINGADAAAVREFTDARNKIAHELLEIIGGGDTPDFAGLFPQLIELIAKIDRWWVINVEIADDREFAGKDIDSEGVTPGSLLVMQMLWCVALGEEDEAWELYRIFVEMGGSE